MSAYNTEVKGFIKKYKGSITNAWNTTLNTLPAPAAKDHFKELRPQTIQCAAVAVFPNGDIKVLELDESTHANNWINANPQPCCILFKDTDGSCRLIITEKPLGKGAAGRVYPAAKIRINNGGSISLKTNQPIVVKAAAIGHEETLVHEVQFKIGDVVPHGKPGKRVFGVGNISVAIFNHIPGQKLIEEINFERLKVTDTLLELSFEERCQLVIDLSSQIQKMHEAEVSHNDLNLENVLVKKENGQYKACPIDFGQAEYFGTKIKPILLGKRAWNGAEQALSSLEANSKIDIVPLGVMCYIIFAAKAGRPETDYNPFIAKQIALKVAGDFQIEQAKAVAHTPFIMGESFIEKDWKLEIATANRLNELMHVFFERMVSDIPAERPTAEEVKEFFTRIQNLHKLNELNNNENILENILAENRILLQCYEIAYQEKENASRPVRILELQRILSSPHYLSSQTPRFLTRKINELIALEKEVSSSEEEVSSSEEEVEPSEKELEPSEKELEPSEKELEPSEKEVEPSEKEANFYNTYTVSMLEKLSSALSALRALRKTAGRADVGLTVSTMQMILFAKGRIQFLKEIKAKFGCEDFKSLRDSMNGLLSHEELQALNKLTPDERKKLSYLSENNAVYEQKNIAESEDSSEDQKKEACRLLKNLQLMKKQDRLFEMQLYLMRYGEFALKYQIELSKTRQYMSTPSESFHPFSSFLEDVSICKKDSTPVEPHSEESKVKDFRSSFSSLASFSAGNEPEDFMDGFSSLTFLPEVDDIQHPTLLNADKEDGSLLRSISALAEAKVPSDEEKSKKALAQYKLSLCNFKELIAVTKNQTVSHVNNGGEDAVVLAGQDFLDVATVAVGNEADSAALTTVLDYNCHMLVEYTELRNATLKEPLVLPAVRPASRPKERAYHIALNQLEHGGKKEIAAKALKALSVVCEVAARLLCAVCTAFPPMWSVLSSGVTTLTHKSAEYAVGADMMRYGFFSKTSSAGEDSSSKPEASAGVSVAPAAA